MKTPITIGRILRANAAGCMVGCQTLQTEIPAIGDMVRIPAPDGETIYGLLCNILVDDDGLIRQLVTSEQIPESVIQDNRLNRNVPLEMEVRFIGHTRQQQCWHLLPPRPPLSLDQMFLCEAEEIRSFCSAGQVGYFRHLLREKSPFMEEILAAHLQKAAEIMGKPWLISAMNEIILLLRNEYENLLPVLAAIRDAGLIDEPFPGGRNGK